jgi:hypothetical protein
MGYTRIVTFSPCYGGEYAYFSISPFFSPARMRIKHGYFIVTNTALNIVKCVPWKSNSLNLWNASAAWATSIYLFQSVLRYTGISSYTLHQA